MKRSDEAIIEKQARQVAFMYYKGNQGNSPSESAKLDTIAKALGITKSTAFTRLKYARAHKNIIDIKVHAGRDELLENQLSQNFSMGFIVVNEADNLGDEAALYFDQLVNESALESDPWSVAIGGGTTIQSMVDALPVKERRILLLPTMIYGRGPTLGEYVGPIMSLIELRKKSGQKADIHYASVPPFTGNQDADREQRQQIISQNDIVRKTLEEMRNAKAIFTSISPIFADAGRKAPPESAENQLIKHDIRTVLDRIGFTKQKLLDEDIVGDLSYSFFNSHGKGKSEWEVFVCPSIDDYKRAARDTDRKVVLLAAGHGKTAAVWAALSGRLVNMAILDRPTAEALLKKYRTTHSQTNNTR